MVSREHECDLWTQRVSLLHQLCCGCVALCMAVVAQRQPPLGAALSRDTTHVFQIPGLQLSCARSRFRIAVEKLDSANWLRRRRGRDSCHRCRDSAGTHGNVGYRSSVDIQCMGNG